MKRFYILAIVDLDNYGYNTKKVIMYDDKEKAIAKMKELYLEQFYKHYSKDYNPYAQDTYAYQITDDFAYINGTYYIDIFNTDLEY